MTGSASR